VTVSGLIGFQVGDLKPMSAAHAMMQPIAVVHTMGPHRTLSWLWHASSRPVNFLLILRLVAFAQNHGIQIEFCAFVMLTQVLGAFNPLSNS